MSSQTPSDLLPERLERAADTPSRLAGGEDSSRQQPGVYGSHPSSSDLLAGKGLKREESQSL
jgi:hypothetical protein